MLVASKVRAGAIKGDRRSIKRGASVEFADYRNYVAGDDLRQLDWNIYARLERPYIKLLEDEEDLAVHLILDASASMDFPPEGEPDQHKLLYAKRVVAGLAYVSLTSGDRLTLTAVNDRQRGDLWSGARSRPQLRHAAVHSGCRRRQHYRLERCAGGLRAAGAAPGLNAGGQRYVSRDGGYLDGLHALLSRGHEVAFVHVLAPEEVRPPVAGDLSLVDVETELQQEVTVDGAMLGIYQQRLAAWRAEMRDECLRRGRALLPAGDGPALGAADLVRYAAGGAGQVAAAVDSMTSVGRGMSLMYMPETMPIMSMPSSNVGSIAEGKLAFVSFVMHHAAKGKNIHGLARPSPSSLKSCRPVTRRCILGYSFIGSNSSSSRSGLIHAGAHVSTSNAYSRSNLRIRRR